MSPTRTKNLNTALEKVNLEQIEQSIANGTFSVVKDAKAYGISSANLRAILIQTFGDKVEFKRGRSGGVRFRQTEG
jgi:hypothetical protein